MRLKTKLTYCGNYGTDKVESSREVPARSQSVHTDACDEGLLIVPQQSLQVLQVQPVLPGEVSQLFLPALVRPQLRRTLEGGEHQGPTEQVEQDERRQQAKTSIVLIQVQWKATAAPGIRSARHDLSTSRKRHSQTSIHTQTQSKHTYAHPRI